MSKIESEIASKQSSSKRSEPILSNQRTKTNIESEKFRSKKSNESKDSIIEDEEDTKM